MTKQSLSLPELERELSAKRAELEKLEAFVIQFRKLVGADAPATAQEATTQAKRPRIRKEGVLNTMAVGVPLTTANVHLRVQEILRMDVSKEAVTQALSRLAKDGKIRQISRGLWKRQEEVPAQTEPAEAAPVDQVESAPVGPSDQADAIEQQEAAEGGYAGPDTTLPASPTT